jgi:hypothetical protein
VGILLVKEAKMSDEYFWSSRQDQDYDDEWDYGTQPDEIYIVEWWEPGPYTGVGPSSYQPSDERIRENVNDRLFLDGSLDASQIDTSVQDGVVTLSGSVSSRQDKRRAEDIAESVFGVVDVNNNLSVNKEGHSQQSQQSEQRARQYEQSGPRYQPRLHPQGSPRGQRYERYGEQSMQREEEYQRRLGQSRPGTQRTTQGGIPSVQQQWQHRREVFKLVPQGELRRNMRVLGWDNQLVGFIREFFENGFLVDRVRGPDVFLPYNSIDAIGQRVHLNVTADSLDR